MDPAVLLFPPRRRVLFRAGGQRHMIDAVEFIRSRSGLCPSDGVSVPYFSHSAFGVELRTRQKVVEE